MSIEPPPARKLRVLIVDDEPAVLAFARRVLRQPGYETSAAANGIEALRVVDAEGPFDLVVTDLNMPEMAGDELAAELRRRNPVQKILYFTGCRDRLFAGGGALSEGEALLEKPASVHAMLQAAAALLARPVPPPRADRVRVPNARVRIAQESSELIVLGINGVLTRTGAHVDVDSVYPLVLDLPGEQITVTARVVSKDPAGAASSMVQDVAFAFVDLSPEARRALERVCRASAGERVPGQLIG